MDVTMPDISASMFRAAQASTKDAAQKVADIQASAPNMDAIEAAAKEFEAVFISEMMKPMFAGIKTEAPFGGGKGEEVFRSMMVQEYGKMIAGGEFIGIADHVKTEMIKMQEARS